MIPRHRLLLLSLLLLAVASCAQPADPAAAAYDRVVSALERGDLGHAEELVRENEQQWRDAARSPWYWRFRLLNAEVLMGQGRAADALAVVEKPFSVDADALPLEARRLKILGHASLNLGRYEDAATFLEDAARQSEVANLPRLAIEIEVLRGLFLIRTNNHAAGESVTQAAYAHAVERQDAYWQAAAANNLGLERMRSFRYDEAIPFLEQALRAADSIQAQRYSAASLANLGMCYYRIGDFEKALSNLQKARDRQEQIGAMGGLQSSLGEIGNVHMMQGRADQAVTFYERALMLARSSAPFDAVRWAGSLARAHTELRQWDQAETFARESLTLQQRINDSTSAAYRQLDSAMIAAGRSQHEQAIRLYEETIVLARENAELTWVANAELAKEYRALGDLKRASLYFERCLRTIAETRSRLSRADYKLTFFSRLIELYQQYVDLLVASGEVDKALQVADSSRALLLSERLELDGASRVAMTRTDLQQIARQLNVVFLSYWLAPGRSFLWVISGQTFKLLELPARERIAPLVDEYRTFIETSVRNPIAADFQPARELSNILLAPARSLIPPGSHVVVVPDGPLHALNLETLPVFEGTPHYLIEDVTVSVAPSLALVTAVTWPRLPDTGALLLIGDPEPGGPDFPRLAHAGSEIASIRTRFGAREAIVLTGSAATPAAFSASRPERFSIIHFAAHATANHASPLDSSVVLSPHGGGYLLSARDVLGHTLQADLVTISACRSAGATVYGGEGMVGFVWAFLQTGARSVIAGLWDVSDRSTSQLMETLYARLHTGEAPAIALRQAKRDLIRAGGAYANPYYWGPFQIYVGGATRPLRPARPATGS